MGLGFVRPFSTVILFPKRGLTSNSKSPLCEHIIFSEYTQVRIRKIVKTDNIATR